MGKDSYTLDLITAQINDETSDEVLNTSIFKMNIRSGQGAQSKEPDKCKISKLELRTTDQLTRRFKVAMLSFCKYLHTVKQQLKCTCIFQSWFFPGNEGGKGKDENQENPLSYDIIADLSFIFINSLEREHGHQQVEAEKSPIYFNPKFWVLLVLTSV